MLDHQSGTEGSSREDLEIMVGGSSNLLRECGRLTEFIVSLFCWTFYYFRAAKVMRKRVDIDISVGFTVDVTSFPRMELLTKLIFADAAQLRDIVSVRMG